MLIICPTPIGNLEDTTDRQRQALQSADVIACEDTRTTGKLLERLGIPRPQGRPELVSYHEHNARERVGELLARIEAGERVVLVSDAGTPTISDPGYRLVHEASAQGLALTALPGPVAAIVALSASGLPTDRFLFEGFLPAKARARRQRLEELAGLGTTLLFYESPHRLLDTLEAVTTVFGDEHPVCVGRELTKIHEEYVRGQASRVHEELAGRDRLRGEFALVVAPLAEDALRERLGPDQLAARVRELLAEGRRTRTIRDMLAPISDLTSSELYEFIEDIKRDFDSD